MFIVQIWGKELSNIFGFNSLIIMMLAIMRLREKILDNLVSDNGTCAMWKEFKNDFRIDPSQRTGIILIIKTMKTLEEKIIEILEKVKFRSDCVTHEKISKELL